MSIILLAMATIANLPHDIFGINVGQPLSYAECPESTTDFSGKPIKHDKHYSFSYEYPKETPCYRRIKNRGTKAAFEPFERVEIDYPTPLKLGFYGATAIVNDGIVSWIYVTTLGELSQDINLAALTEKYGKPNVFNRDAVQNGFGAKFTRISARWDLGRGVEAEFTGFAQDRKSGLFLLSTEFGRQEQKRRSAANLQLGRDL